MSALRTCVGLLFAAATFGCGGRIAALEDGEWLPGGDTTNTLLLGPNAFLMPAQNLSAEHELEFYSGNSFFNQAWVEAPASTDARDGLGPLFNARSCSACHFRDGKGAPPTDGAAPFEGLLLRLSIEGPEGLGPDPVYGGQLQDQALPGVPVEGLPRIVWDEAPGRYADGTAYRLARPTYLLEEPGYGAFPEGLLVSPRVAPHMVGLGLLEAIPEERLLALADPEDADGDGVSGRVQRLQTAEGERIGRFGWKGDAPDVAAQSAGAFAGDLGLTSPQVSLDDCTESQIECLEHVPGGDPEVDSTIFERVVLYSRAVAVPVRRAADDEEVLRGKWLFTAAGCAACHTPSHTTGAAALPELEGQLIWPYTDLLLHDLGPGLADERPLALASGREWKTPPLWGLGLIEDVGGHTRYLHDGRARSLEEAVLWHGGEAQEATDAFLAMDAEDRAALLRFVGDL